MTTEVLAYAAGIIDGEGCISAFTKATGQFKLKVMMQNTSPALIEWFVSHFGGCVSVRNKPDPTHRTLYMWEIGGAECGGFLQQILPFMVIKTRQAEAGIALASTFRKGTKTDTELLIRARLAEIIREGNATVQ